MVVSTIIAYCNYKDKDGKAFKASTTVQIAIFRYPSAGASEVIIDERQIGAYIVGGVKGSTDSDRFVAIVKFAQQNRHLSPFGYVIKSGFERSNFSAGAFRGDTYFKIVIFIKNIYYTLHKIIAFAAVDRVAAQPPEYNAHWKFKKRIFADKADIFPQCTSHQQTQWKIQAGGMRYYGYNVFGGQGVGLHLYPPSERTEYPGANFAKHMG